MKNALIIIGMLFSATLLAQNFNKDLEGKMVPAKMIFGDGIPQEIEMKYQAPEFYKNQFNKFTIRPSFQDEPYTHSGGIEAFMVEGNIWALRPNLIRKTEFVVMGIQGAIERYTYIKYDRKPGTDDENFAIIGSRIGTITHKVGTNDYIEGEVPNEIVKKWISDSPEVLEELTKAETEANEEKEKQKGEVASSQPAPKKKGLMGAIGKLAEMDATEKKQERITVDMGRIINNYNAWYENNNPGQVKYYFIEAPQSVKAPQKTLTLEEKRAKTEAKLADQYAGRSADVSPEVASAKENQPAKKETFADKMSRIKSDGNKIGVIFYLKPAAVPKPSTSAAGPSMMMKEVMPGNEVQLEGEYLDESLASLGQDFTDELNKALGTTEIELIDINKIPYKDLRMGRVDDWWATKYKVVFAYTVDPRVTLSKREVDGKSQSVASVNMITSLLAMEYIGSSDDPKQKVVAQVLNMGSFVTPAYAQDEDMADIQEVYEKCLEKLETPLLDKIETERADAVAKLVEKKLK